MALLNFPYTQDRGMSRSVRTTASNIEFGDGYVQRISNSIHPIRITFNVSFSNRDNYVDIEDFLIERKGIEAFMFEQQKVICQQWTTTEVTVGIGSIQAEFRRVFE